MTRTISGNSTKIRCTALGGFLERAARLDPAGYGRLSRISCSRGQSILVGDVRRLHAVDDVARAP